MSAATFEASGMPLAVYALYVAARCGDTAHKQLYTLALMELVKTVESIAARDKDLNAKELVPTGDDYNYVLNQLCVDASFACEKESGPSEVDVLVSKLLFGSELPAMESSSPDDSRDFKRLAF